MLHNKLPKCNLNILQSTFKKILVPKNNKDTLINKFLRSGYSTQFVTIFQHIQPFCFNKKSHLLKSVALFKRVLYITIHRFLRKSTEKFRGKNMGYVKVVLLQKVSKLGTIGDVVKVKPGFARNYLLPKKIALRATNENLKYFEDQRAQIEAANEKSRAEAEKIAEKMKNLSVSLIRQASEKGQLYGSVTGRDIANAISTAGFAVSAGQINLNTPIKMLGIYELSVELHPEVIVPVKLSVAKSEEEAKQQISKERKKGKSPKKPSEQPAAEPVEEATAEQ